MNGPQNKALDCSLEERKTIDCQIAWQKGQKVILIKYQHI